jgi:hypothetical protein
VRIDRRGRAAVGGLTTALAALAAAAFLLLPVPALASDGHELTGVHVRGGEGYTAYNSFAIEWDPNPAGSPPVKYVVSDSTGRPLPGYPLGETGENLIGGVRVPGPGNYLFLVWNPGNWPPSQVRLNFDDERPAPVALTAPARLAAGTPITARIAFPHEHVPISGIAGYAVTLDAQKWSDPCARADGCAPGNLIAPGQALAGQVTFPPPPEGVNYIHAVAVTATGMESPAVTTAEVLVDGTPPRVRLEGTPEGWSAEPVRVTALADDALSAMTATGPDGPITALGVDGRPPLIEPGDRASATISGDGVHRLSFYARDALGNSGDGSLPLAGPGAAVVRIDESGPTVRFAAPDPGDPERIEAIVGDGLSGPDPDRGAIAVRPVGTSARFQPLPTTTRRGHLVARWSSDDYPRGPYEFRATGFDLAGNSKTTNLAAGGGAFVLQNPVKREARLAFGFGAGRLVFQRCSRADGSRRCHRTVVRPFARRPPARTVPCCHGALVGGRLVDADGAPLAGQTVEVVESFAAGAHNENRRTTLTTDTDGRFSTRLAPGPSREITAEFPGTGRLTRAAGRQIRLRVRAAVHLRVSTGHVRVGGAPVVFKGRIAHPETPIPPRGLPVQLQFRLPGMPWTEFRTVQSDAYGSFRYPYSFSDDDSADVRFQFRAALPAAGGWPFAPATSRPVAVTG